MGLQQDASVGIADEIGEELVVFPDHGEPLRQFLIFPPVDVGHRQRKDAFCSLSLRALLRTSSSSPLRITGVTVAASSHSTVNAKLSEGVVRRT